MGQFPVSYLNVGVVVGEFVRKSACHVDAPMLSSRTSNRNGQVTSIVVPKSRQPGRQVRRDVGQHLFDVLVTRQERNHRLIQTCHLAQFSLPVWVGQAAYVEHEIGINRNTVLKRERLEKQREVLTFLNHTMSDQIA